MSSNGSQRVPLSTCFSKGFLIVGQGVTSSRRQFKPTISRIRRLAAFFQQSDLPGLTPFFVADDWPRPAKALQPLTLSAARRSHRPVRGPSDCLAEMRRVRKRPIVDTAAGAPPHTFSSLSARLRGPMSGRNYPRFVPWEESAPRSRAGRTAPPARPINPTIYETHFLVQIPSPRLESPTARRKHLVTSCFSFGTNALRPICSSANPVQTANRLWLGGATIGYNSFLVQELASSNPVAIFAAID